jgi:hypothetical protein
LTGLLSHQDALKLYRHFHTIDPFFPFLHSSFVSFFFYFLPIPCYFCFLFFLILLLLFFLVVLLNSIKLHPRQDRTSGNGSSESIDWGCGGGKWREIGANATKSWWRFTADWEFWAQLVYISYQNPLGRKLSMRCKITV